MEDKKVKGKNIIKQLLHAGKLQQGQPHSHFSYHPPNPERQIFFLGNDLVKKELTTNMSATMKTCRKNKGNYNWKKAETYDISTN